MGIETALIAGSLALAAGSTAVSISSSNKAAKAQNEALSYQKQQNDLAAMRQKRDAIRASRIAQANATNAGANQNVSESSSAQGGVGSIQSQLNSNLSFLDKWNYYSDQASNKMGEANSAQQSAQTWAKVGGLSMDVFNNAGSISGKISKIFPSTPTGSGRIFRPSAS